MAIIEPRELPILHLSTEQSTRLVGLGRVSVRADHLKLGESVKLKGKYKRGYKILPLSAKATVEAIYDTVGGGKIVTVQRY